jgi:hypothetical protein
MKPSTCRVDFRADQLLSACDLLQASRRAADLLALHAARGHAVWGVVTGYLCHIDGLNVVIAPGMALDRCGHPLLNPGQLRLPVPPLPRDGQTYVVDLIASQAATADLVDGCEPKGLPPERASLRWEVAGRVVAGADGRLPHSPRVRLGMDVPLARLTATAVAPLAIDTGSRPVAHALIRPKIASGQVPQSSAQTTGTWADWTMPVSTTTAGFDPGSSPVYLVRLDAHPFGDTSSLGLATGDPHDLPNLMTQWVGPFVSIATKDHSGFTMRVVTANTNEWAKRNSPGTNPVPVSWIGVGTADPGPFLWWLFLLQFPTSVVI